MRSLTEYATDVLIIGSGAAGLSLALRLAGYCDVIIISKSVLNEGSTFYAQGGIAAVLDTNDTIDSHINDTLIAGAGLCNREIVNFIVSNANHCIQWLIDHGINFDTETSNKIGNYYHLNCEGGHSHRRILHVADATGKVLENTLVKNLSLHRNIITFEKYNAIDLITSDQLGIPGIRRVVGAYIWNSAKNIVELCYTRIVVLATGGASKVYKYTTNPDISSGDGIAMAWRVGCRVANLEFNQFHPTCLYHPNASNFLLTEALRGEGAYLCRPDGSRFMADFDARAELASRDIVTRAINYEMNRLGVNCMYLDITHKSETFIRHHFPTIYDKLIKLNIDITRQPIPIVPAAHYTCGGIIVDKHGCTDIQNLYAIGEVSYTGLHGANRLASNSLLECLVYGWSASEDIRIKLPNFTQISQLPPWSKKQIKDLDNNIVLKQNLHELRLVMWNYVGIVRSNKGLEHALLRIKMLTEEIEEYYSYFSISNKLLEIRNLVQVADLIIKSAVQRKESRGLHFTLDYPTMQKDSIPTVLKQ